MTYPEYRISRLGRIARRTLLPLCMLWLCTLTSHGQQSLRLPRLQAPAFLEAAAGLDDSDSGQLIEAAFFFSSASAEREAAARLRLEALLAQAAGLSGSHPDPYQRGEAVMQLLHQQVLRLYHEPTSNLDAALLEGRYNCVSSSILFFLLARAAGLDVSGVLTTDHSFCVVRLSPDRLVDAETTNPFGWDPGSRKDFADSQGQAAGYRYVPPGNYSQRHTVNGRALVTLIAQNNATLFERRQQWTQALELMIDAWTWYPEDSLYTVLSGRLGNYVAALANSQQWSTALGFLGAFGDRYPIGPELAELISITRQGWLNGYIRQAELEDALAAIDHEPDLDAGLREEMIGFVYNRAADLASRGKDWLAAWRLLRQGVERYPENRLLSRLEVQAATNWSYSVHNEFARLFNARDYSTARAVLEAALAIDPGNRLLTDNLRRLQAEGR